MLDENSVVRNPAGAWSADPRKQRAPELIRNLLDNLVKHAQRVEETTRHRLSSVTCPQPQNESEVPRRHEVVPDYYELLRTQLLEVDGRLDMIEYWLTIAELPQMDINDNVRL